MERSLRCQACVLYVGPPTYKWTNTQRACLAVQQLSHASLLLMVSNLVLTSPPNPSPSPSHSRPTSACTLCLPPSPALNAVRAASIRSASLPVTTAALPSGDTSTVVAEVAMKPSIWHPRSLRHSSGRRQQERATRAAAGASRGASVGCVCRNACAGQSGLSSCRLLAAQHN